jgi:hypothetical protein
VNDIDRALAEIGVIRGHMARAAEFRGYGPATIALTGVLALIAAMVQSRWLPTAAHDIASYLTIWIVTAALSVTIITVETVARTRRVHSALGPEMIYSAAEQFLPAVVAGLLLTVVLLRCASQSIWMLPGLWQILFALGVFSSCQFLPRSMFAAGLWYLGSGLTCLAFGQGALAYSPWEMGVPFGIGQLLVAAVLQFGYREADDGA